MTTPRDLIEAPRNEAAERHLRILREWCDDGIITPGTLIAAQEGVNEALAAARDEGRQEAVRLLRDLRREMPGMPTADYAVLSMVLLNRIEKFLDGVARHGRSSDPATTIEHSGSRLGSTTGSAGLKPSRDVSDELELRDASSARDYSGAGRSGDPEPAPHVHHWGNDGKCMQPRCDYAVGPDLGYIRTFDDPPEAYDPALQAAGEPPNE